MGRYLVVTHKTGDSPELLEALKRIQAGDREAQFELLVPATPMRPLVSEVTEDGRLAEERAAAVAEHLRREGLAVTAATAGDANVVDAIRDHLTGHGGYHTLVIATLPPGISRWLRLDVVARAERLLGRPAIHVVAESTEQQLPARNTAVG